MHPIHSMRQQLKEYLKGFDPDVYTDDDAAELVVWFADIERSGAAGKLLSARRIEKSGLHEREGHKEAGSWLAGLTGESVGQATSKLDTARRGRSPSCGFQCHQVRRHLRGPGERDRLCCRSQPSSSLRSRG